MAFDARDKEISIDDYVRYVDTGTVGKVLDIKMEDETGWVLIDKTNLWYKSKLVEILEEKDINIKDTPTGRELDVEELKERAEKLENIELDSNVAEGGG
ncbi:MAG: DUF2098 domain-containing protein [Methanobrevibacter sp.]|nr:DUF2098 domain-containing protein [Methanobrevibacter sp.]